MITDKIADLLTRIRNAQKSAHPTVSVSASKYKENVLKILLQEGYIASYEHVKDADDKASIKIYLKYAHDNAPAIREIKRVSKSGRRYYVNKDKIPVFRNGLGIVIVSTSMGILSGTDAKKNGVGGEVVCSVF